MHNVWRIIKRLNFTRAVNLSLIAVNSIALILFKKEFFTPSPYSFTIELTNFCNLKCPQCITGIGHKEMKKGKIKKELFENIIDNIKRKAVMVQLHFRGESMMHSQIFEFIQYAVRNKLYTSLSTNGHFIEQNELNIINSGLEHINISLDGLDQEVYSQYRINGNFELVKKGILNLAEKKIKKNTGKPRITVQMLVNKYNEKQIGLFKALKKIEGIDACILKSMQIINSEMKDKFLPSSNHYKRKVKSQKKIVCLKTLTTGVFTWDGKLVPCCYDKLEKFVIKNSANNINIYEVCKRLKKFRKQLITNKIEPDICKNCEVFAQHVYFN